MRRLSLRARLAIAAALAVAAAIAIVSVGAYVGVQRQLTSEVDHGLQDRLVALRQLEQQGGPQGTPGGALQPPAPPLGGPAGYVQAVTATGQIQRPPGETTTLPVDARVRALASGAGDQFYSTAMLHGVHVRILNAAAGTGLAVQIARPLTEVDAVLARLRTLLVIGGAFGIGLAAALGLLVARAALRPVRVLTEAVEEITVSGDLRRELEVHGDDELARLARSFETMLRALASSLDAQRQLVADASHELRTPLTSLRTNVEVLARPDGVPTATRERILADVKTELEEMTLLVGDVVELARGTEPDAAQAPVRLDAIVADAVERARRHAPALRFEVASEPTLVRGGAARLDRAVANLLDNAIKWSPPDGTVEVAVAGGVVTVRDHGPGIAETDLPRVFDRFYRAPAARGMRGSGLGLAIVRQTAEQHGGEVAAERAEGGGTRMRLTLPIVG